jgi:hypothetical protein
MSDPSYIETESTVLVVTGDPQLREQLCSALKEQRYPVFLRKYL